MAEITEIRLTPSKVALLRKLNDGAQLIRSQVDWTFRVGTPSTAYTTVNRLAAEAVIDYKLVDSQGPTNPNNPLYSAVAFEINAKGRAWCEANPEGPV